MPFDLGITRDGLREIKGRMALGTLAYPSPRELLRQYSDKVDDLVRKAFQRAQSHIPSQSVCLMAVGGYGRSELAPYSDIDLLLLHSSSNPSDLSSLAEKVLYPLWDLGLEVSCGSRSITESLRMAQSDLYVKTGLIDGRYLDGEYEFFRNLYTRFTKKVLHQKVRRFAAAMMKDLYSRQQKYEDPAYVLEPNIKEGQGGLRDFQISRWIIRAKYKTDRWDLILFPDHSRTLDNGVQFLWAVRNQLHLLSGRRQDDLNFEMQEKIAPALGFSSGTKGIEEMMRQYHLSTQRIANLASGILHRSLYEPSPLKKAFFIFQRKKIDHNFRLDHGTLRLLDPVLFKKDPFHLMTLFKHCQTYRMEMDYRMEEAVVEALPFLDGRFRTEKVVKETFLSILREGEGAEAILKKMHDLGFLSKYIPEFSEIEGRVHYDLYHVHPVDIHSILTVGELEKLRMGLYQKSYPLLSSLVQEVEKPEILFLTALLHDIGKGVHGDHALIGAELAKAIGGRMGLSKDEKELIHFLVSHHLLMLEVAFRRDLHDEQAVLRFAHRVKTLSRLKMLYLLTFADIKAVGPETWTDWKNLLLMELFLKTSRFFEKHEDFGSSSNEIDLSKGLEEFLSPSVVSEYSEHLPVLYLSRHPLKEIARHIEMARLLAEESLFAEWEIEEGIRAKVTICTRDRYGLFSRIAGSMFVNRLNILEAQIHTWANGVALDTFYVEDVTGEAERRLKQFKKDLEAVLSGAVHLKELIAQREEKNLIRPKVIPKVPSEVKIDNQDSDFYTIIEVTGEDRMGILYEITQALTDHGCNIHFARISTLGNRVVDVFYVQDTWGEKIEEKQKVDHLRKTLLDRMTRESTPS
jgi:[protein-PII] uridylyltransferase